MASELWFKSEPHADGRKYTLLTPSYYKSRRRVPAGQEAPSRFIGVIPDNSCYVVRDNADCTCFEVQQDGTHEPMLVTRDLITALEWLADEEV